MCQSNPDMASGLPRYQSQAANRGVFLFLGIVFPSLFQKAGSAWSPQVADHQVPNQVLGFFEFFREREGGSFLFSKACKSLYRRRFKEIEDAPFAAYPLFLSFCIYPLPSL
jgi:hypothetical protein